MMIQIDEIIFHLIKSGLYCILFYTTIVEEHLSDTMVEIFHISNCTKKSILMYSELKFVNTVKWFR
jgi:hypothetical protein